MREEISLKVRLIAVSLHLLGGLIAASIVLVIAIYALASYQINDNILAVVLMIIPMFFFLSPLFTATLWVNTKELHPFVNQAGRDAINCLLNTMLGLLLSFIFTIFVFSITCGIGNPDPTPFVFSFITFVLVAITYFIKSIVAAIFALQGYRLNSPLIYPFIKPL